MGRKKILVYSVAIIALIIFIKSLFHIQLNLSEDQFTDINQCPACYGSNLCPHFYHSDITLIGISKLKYLNFINSKNVFGGKFLGERIILKKLAHDWEIIEKDKLICNKAELTESCEVKKAIQLLIGKSFVNKSKNSLVDLVNVFGSKTDISQCPSQRLLTYIFNKMYSQQIAFHSVEQTQIFKLSELMYSLLLNPEALILQAFSQSEGWPFPHYYGACGRVVVEEYVGRTIAYYENAPWKQRLDIAYQLLLIAQMLTENFSHFAFYMTDVNMDNFAVKPDGTVLLIDVESIVIVDRFNEGKG